MRAYTPGGSRRRICSIRLARSTYSFQSSVEQSRRLVMELPIEHVVHGEALVLGAHRVLHRRARFLEPRFEPLAQFGRTDAILAHALQQLVHERDVQHAWQAAVAGRSAAWPRTGRSSGPPRDARCGSRAVPRTVAAGGRSAPA
jgi:hypothetical protein